MIFCWLDNDDEIVNNAIQPDTTIIKRNQNIKSTDPQILSGNLLLHGKCICFYLYFLLFYSCFICIDESDQKIDDEDSSDIDRTYEPSSLDKNKLS